MLFTWSFPSFASSLFAVKPITLKHASEQLGLGPFYIQGRVGLYEGLYVTVGSVVLCGAADAVVQGGVIGSAGELPEKYMQAVMAGTAGSNII